MYDMVDPIALHDSLYAAVMIMDLHTSGKQQLGGIHLPDCAVQALP